MMDTTTYQIVTNLSCNLDCEYCYERKNTQANEQRDIVDFITACFDADRHRDELKTVVVDFIGGEPFMRPDLVECALSLVETLAERDGRSIWITISTNATLFHKPRVRQLIETWGSKMAVGVSIDGQAHVHNKHRVFASDGAGSYDAVLDGIKFLDGKVNSLGFKATFTRETIGEYAESMIHILDICAGLKHGFTDVAGNAVFEDVLDKEMAPMIANQMVQVIDKWVEYGFHTRRGTTLGHFVPEGQNPHDLFNKDKVKLLKSVENIGDIDPDRVRPYCGAVTAMKCLGFNRKVYGCNRFMTSFPDNAIVAEVVDQKLVSVPQNFEKELEEQFTDYPEECQRCPLKGICGSCAAAPYEYKDGTKVDRQEYHSQKRQCGWTFAKAMAFEYWYRLFGTYDKRTLQPKCNCDACKCGES